jgi:peptidyl-tRNA hydrolase, PTH2 family
MPNSRTPRAVAGEYKMVLVLRGELRLTAGKSAVQAAHAAVMLVDQPTGHHRTELELWRRQGQKKIGLVASTLDDLERIERSARAKGIRTAWVRDAGLTEVPPGTVTCLGLGPALASDLDPITGDLPLL